MTSKKSTSSNGRHSTILSFEYDSGETITQVSRSIRQEVGQIPGERASGEVQETASAVVVRVEAADLSALRAGVHTWCSLVESAEATVSTIDG